MSGLTKEVLAGQDAKGIQHLRNAIKNGVGKPEERTRALQLVHETIADPLLAGKMSSESEKAFKAILQDEAFGSYQGNVGASSGQNNNP